MRELANQSGNCDHAAGRNTGGWGGGEGEECVGGGDWLMASSECS